MTEEEKFSMKHASVLDIFVTFLTQSEFPRIAASAGGVPPTETEHTEKSKGKNQDVAFV